MSASGGTANNCDSMKLSSPTKVVLLCLACLFEVLRVEMTVI